MVVLMLLGSAGAARHRTPAAWGEHDSEGNGDGVRNRCARATGTPLGRRRVSAINMATKRHYDATTADQRRVHDQGACGEIPSGGRAGAAADVIATQPSQPTVTFQILDAQLDFVIGR